MEKYLFTYYLYIWIIFLGKHEIFHWFKAKPENIYHQRLMQLSLMEKQFLDPKLLVDLALPNGIFIKA